MNPYLPSRRGSRALTAALILTLVPGALMAAPSDRDDRRSERKERRERAERVVERRQEVRRDRREDRREARREDRRVERRDHRHVERSSSRHRHAGHRHTLGCGCVEVIRPGYYKTVVEEVRTPGHYERVWVPAKKIRLGRHVNVELCEGHYEKVWVPGEVRCVERRVWVPAERVIDRTCHRHSPRHCD